MAVATRWVLFVSVLLFGYWLYTPMPSGYSVSSSFKLQLVAATCKLVTSFVSIGDSVGLSSYIPLHKVEDKLNDMFGSLSSELDPSVTFEDAVFNGVRVRIYKPKTSKQVLPGLVYFHGGGWVVANIESVQGITGKICKDSDTVVVSVDNRLAPEFLFPIPFEDCLAATKYFLENAKKFNVDQTRIAVAGDSAGGNFAAAVSLKLRDEDFTPKLKLQVLIYPVLQTINFQLPSHVQNRDAPFTNTASVIYYVNLYFDGGTDKLDSFIN